jgi:hypothetical protein
MEIDEDRCGRNMRPYDAAAVEIGLLAGNFHFRPISPLWH